MANTTRNNRSRRARTGVPLKNNRPPRYYLNNNNSNWLSRVGNVFENTPRVAALAPNRSMNTSSPWNTMNFGVPVARNADPRQAMLWQPGMKAPETKNYRHLASWTPGYNGGRRRNATRKGRKGRKTRRQ